MSHTKELLAENEEHQRAEEDVGYQEAQMLSTRRIVPIKIKGPDMSLHKPRSERQITSWLIWGNEEGLTT